MWVYYDNLLYNDINHSQSLQGQKAGESYIAYFGLIMSIRFTQMTDLIYIACLTTVAMSVQCTKFKKNQKGKFDNENIMIRLSLFFSGQKLSLSSIE